VADDDVNLEADVGAGDWMHLRDWTRRSASIWKDHNSKKKEDRDNKNSEQLTTQDATTKQKTKDLPAHGWQRTMVDCCGPAPPPPLEEEEELRPSLQPPGVHWNLG